MIDLRCGDCLEILPSLPSQSVEAIITDLPYGTTACKWDVIIPFEPMWREAKRVLKPRGVFVTTASQPFTSELVMSNRDWFRYSLIWEKSMGSGFLDANRKPLKVHEDICIFSEGRTTYNPQMATGTAYKKRVDRTTQRGKAYNDHRAIYQIENTGERYPRSILKIPNGNSGSVHPTQKPVALYEYLVKTYTNPGDTVLDFCAGSGTTGVACVNTGRNFIGVEKELHYYEIMERRIAEAQMQPALFQVGA